MPLIQSSSKAAREKNTKTEIEQGGKDPEQAEAIAYSVQRKNKDGMKPVADALRGVIESLKRK